MSRKVLVICQHFVPYTPSVGGVARVAHLSEFLVSNGLKVHVLSSDGVNYGDLGFSSLFDQIEVTYLKDPLKYSIQQGLRLATHQNPGRRGLLMALLRWAKSLVSRVIIPDFGALMIFKYYKAASVLIRKNSYNTVIVSTPPHSMQIVGGLLKRRFADRITLVSDFRDSWNGSTIFSPKGKIAKIISMNLESFVLRRSDIVTYVSNPMLSKMKTLYPTISFDCKGVLVMNGFAGAPCSISEKENHGEIDIGYFGMADDDSNGYRNIEPLLKSVEIAVKSGKVINIHFYGSLRLTRININDYKFVRLHKTVQHNNVSKVMQSMDYLLILHTDKSNSDEVVTGKLFDYIQARRPIICFSPENMEAVRLIKQYDFGVWIDCFCEKVAVEAFIKLNATEYEALSDDEVVSNFSRSSQYKKLFKKMMELN